MLERAKRASHIDPPKLPGAIMRRAFQRPSAERTVGSAGKFTESLTPDPELENSLGQESAGVSSRRLRIIIAKPQKFDRFVTYRPQRTLDASLPS